jgi:hypothetical protein
MISRILNMIKACFQYLDSCNTEVVILKLFSAIVLDCKIKQFMATAKVLLKYNKN